jgi:hypothetical protein
MCPWRENRAKETMWPEGKDRPKDDAQEGNEAGEKMGPGGRSCLQGRVIFGSRGKNI